MPRPLLRVLLSLGGGALFWRRGMTRKRALAHGYVVAISMVAGGVIMGRSEWFGTLYLLGIAFCGLGSWFLGALATHAQDRRSPRL